MIDKKTAVKIKSAMLTCVDHLDRSVKDAVEGSSDKHSSMYRRLVGQVMGQLFTEILMPVYVAHPDLEPDELKRARQVSGSEVMPLETGAKLMGVLTAVAGTLHNLQKDLSQEPGEEARSLGSALKDPLDSLQFAREFIIRICPGIEQL